MTISTGRFLVKFRDAGAAKSMAISAPDSGAKAAITLDTEPLFQSVGVSGQRAFAGAGGWRIATARAETGDEASAWKVCHAIAAERDDVTFVEPDFVQQWDYRPALRRGRGFAARSGGPEPQDIGDGYAGDPGNNYWFRNSLHSQFDAAAEQTSGGAGVRIAHLDTGYDPAHASVPKRLRADLAGNFVEGDGKGDATDRSDGAIANNFSHGCGTLSILAGARVPGLKPFGCAPEAEIVPVRVANRVVLFSNTSIARGLDYVHKLCASDATRVHVVSLSMGGIPSQAWAEAVNALYEAGVVVVAAAGNNFDNLPTRFIVYPARFGRVIAACGVMADGRPYANLPKDRMAGNYGPDSKTRTALAAYTPNIPWARFGEPTVVDFDGNGTSAATPQVAGAAALWIEKHRAEYAAYSDDWMRAEAVRKALLGAAGQGVGGGRGEFGSGMLRAADTLSRNAASRSTLNKTATDSAGFAFLRLLLGDSSPGLTAAKSRMSMLELEAAQVAVKAGVDPDAAPKNAAMRRELIENILSRPDISPQLRAAIERAGVSPVYPREAKVTQEPATEADKAMGQHFLRLATTAAAPEPPFRRLRIYAYDPGQGTDPTMFDVSVANVTVRWEPDLKPGPIGEYLEVVDFDPASRACYAPVDLNDPGVLAESGLTPSEANPQFHQQMAYTVAMRTIDRFERALGRKALWATRKPDKKGDPPDDGFVPRLRIYPHALREANAYYDPQKIALLFGYFNATDASGTVTAGARIFSVVSHDIVAHETTHALLDGLHPRYSEQTNYDMAAFHEAFADIVALFQHFSMPESLTRQIRRARGAPNEIGRQLGQLARQFGDATGMHGALRKFVGEEGSSVPVLTDDMTEPHDRGAVLVSAVFAAFLTIFKSRCADLIRLATDGSGILPDGDISVDLANRLASEASKSAEHVLNMCIRALDYCPPVNLEFGDYLRGLLTADYDLVRDDDRGYRVAFIDAFRQRGIVPYQIQHLAEDSLLWEPPAMESAELQAFAKLLTNASSDPKQNLDLTWGLSTKREDAFRLSRENAIKIKTWLEDPKRGLIREILGFAEPAERRAIKLKDGTIHGEVRKIEVHSVRVCRRSAPDGSLKSTLVIEITQAFRVKSPEPEVYRGGCTLLLDLNDNQLKYLVRKRLLSAFSVESQIKARAAAAITAAKHGLVYYAPSDPAGRGRAFAMAHRCGRDLT